MGKSNKKAKNEIITITGPKCFIEELGIRTKEEVEKDLKKYKGKAQHKRMCELTYHHIIEKCNGGKADFWNGAIFRNINHIWFNGLSKERQVEINKLCQEYKKACLEKRPFKIAIAEISSAKVEQAKVVDIIPDREVIEIPLYDNTPEDIKKYNEYIEKNRSKKYAKFGKEYKKEINPASIDIKKQREFHREIIEEMRY